MFKFAIIEFKSQEKLNSKFERLQPQFKCNPYSNTVEILLFFTSLLAKLIWKNYDWLLIGIITNEREKTKVIFTWKKDVIGASML